MFAYHFYELLFVLSFNREKRDFSEMFLHHVTAIALIVVSFNINFLLPGSVIMLLHDVTDIFVSIARIAQHTCSDAVVAVCWISMFISWCYLRLYYFPERIIKVYYNEMKDSTDPTIQGTWNFLLTFLCLLYALHWFWVALMLKLLYKRFFNKYYKRFFQST